ncbi:MAG: hypothetical protein V4493_01485 [Pseudomonadota bacterium]
MANEKFYDNLYKGLPNQADKAASTAGNPEYAQPIELPTITMEEAHDEVLNNLVNQARLPNADPNIQVKALEALYKRKYGEVDKSNVHDIRLIMSLLTDEQLKKLEEMAK